MTLVDAVPNPPTSPRPPETPPSSPVPPKSEQMLIKNVRQLVEMLQNLQATQVPAPGETIQPVKTEEASRDKQEAPARASKLEFKTVSEIWDSKAYYYKIANSVRPSDEVTDLDQYIFIVRQRIDKKTLDPTYYIDIKSERLRDILRAVLREVRTINLNGDKPSIEQNKLYIYLYELQSYLSDANTRRAHDSICLKHLGLLVDFIETTYRSTTQRLRSLLETNEITFDLLWALFKPRSIAYTTCFGTGKPRCVIYDEGEERETRNGLKYYKMECRYLDYDGQVFGNASIDLAVVKFGGKRSISSLNAFPLQYHPDEKQTKSYLAECGRRFISMLGAHHRHCRGTAFFMKDGEPFKVSVDSRVMLDASFFRKMNPNYTRPRPDVLDNKTEIHGSFESLLEPLNGRSLDQVQDANIELSKIQEKDLLICCPTVPGFSLGDKLWMEFPVADIKDIEWSSSPLDSLTIPDEQKKIVKALAETRLGLVPSVPFDDVVSGKGKGLNVLLHGTPGIGKTLTAEAVSEHLQRPLYSVSAGELSLEPSNVEIQLSRVFQTASHWNALILLDEADVYMERRSTQDVARNKLVSVFLRKLEYCEGIMFLTTNRVSEFDEAILSRIHLMVKYDKLDPTAKTKIWERLLQKARTPQGGAVIVEKEMESLVKADLNGRQIKNVVTIAHAVATKEGTQVSGHHLLQAVKTTEKFIREFSGPIAGIYS